MLRALMDVTHEAKDDRAYVLYVDDEEPNLIVFRAACSHLFPTLTATSAEQGLELMRTHEVGVLLSDQRMPGMSGTELLARARRLYPAAIRMLVTAYTNLDAAIAAINEGMVRRYISKPWTTGEMVATIGDAYQVYQTETALRGLEQRLLETERYYALGVVTAGIAHELRNPATWVSNSLDLCRRCLEQLREECGRASPSSETLDLLMERMEKLLESAHDGGQRIVDIVRSVEGPTRKAQTETVDMGHLWTATRNLIGYHTGGRITIDETEAAWPTLQGSRTALGQVLSNVLINAVEALEGRENATVWVTHCVQDEVLLVDIEDNGPGLHSDVHERIFDPFHTTGKDGGTGLGLAISRRIAREHGGELSAGDSKRGGARFSLRLPIHPRNQGTTNEPVAGVGP